MLKIVGKGVVQPYCQFCFKKLEKDAVLATDDEGELFSICKKCIPDNCDNQLDKVLKMLESDDEKDCGTRQIYSFEEHTCKDSQSQS